MTDVVVELTPEQIALFSTIVEASKAVRAEFTIYRVLSQAFLRHPGLPGSQLDIYPPDFKALEDLGFFTITRYSGSDGQSSAFDVSPYGRKAYSTLHTQSVSPVHSVEDEMLRYIESESFKHKFPNAYNRWMRAADLLWAEEEDGQKTEIGHFCREALQEFTDQLVMDHPIRGDTNKTSTVARLSAFLMGRIEIAGSTVSETMKALVTYWGTVSDLAQRQEHAASRTGNPLAWEDARRLVFLTLNVMYEVHRTAIWSISRKSG